MVNLGEYHVFLPKNQVVGFLDPEGNYVSEIELDITIKYYKCYRDPSNCQRKKIEKFPTWCAV